VTLIPDDLRNRIAAAFRRRPFGAAASGIVLVLVAVFAVANFAQQPGPPVVDGDPSPAVMDGAAEAEGSSAAGDGGDVGARSAMDLPPDEPAPVRVLPELVPVPASERVAKPTHVRGLYLNAWAAGSTRKLAKLIDIANRTEVNTFVIDVKEGGEVSYRSSLPVVAEIGADRRYIADIRGVLAKMKENGIYPVARIVVFKDAVAAKAKPEWAVVTEDGTIWKDHYGDTWVDSYNRDVWDYNIAIAREAVALGFSEVQWDYVRFPDVPASYMRTAVWPARNGRSKADGIREFLLYSREQLADLGVLVTADVFGLTVSARDDMGIGQLWEKMVDATDVLLPMIYPSHFARGSYGIAYPNGAPFEVITTSLGYGVRRSEGVANAATIRPWLQDFTLGQPRYGPAHVRAQIDGVYDAGLTEWVLWNPGSNYTVDALASADGVVPRFPALGEWVPPAQADESDGSERRSRPDRRAEPPNDTSEAKTIWGMKVRPDTTKRDTTKRDGIW